MPRDMTRCTNWASADLPSFNSGLVPFDNICTKYDDVGTAELQQLLDYSSHTFTCLSSICSASRCS